MTFTNTYDTGTHVTYYGGTAGKPAELCRGIVVAGPATTPWTVALVRLVGASGKTSERDVVIQLWGRGPLNENSTECIVPVLPDGFEVGTPVRVETEQETYYGEIMANVSEGPDTFERAVLEERGFQVPADDCEIFADA